MFEVSSLRTNISSKFLAPLINSHVDSQLFKAAPNFNQPVLQFVDGVDFLLIYMTLHDSPDLVINWDMDCLEATDLEKLSLVFLDPEPPQFHVHDVQVRPWTVTLVLVLQGNVATKLSYGGKFFILVMSHFFLIPTLKEF